MSIELAPLSFPLHGSRLIEASAGTGKTWTIAALYLRLVLGHGGPDAFARPLLPSEILVMTFTRAATRELSNRVRERLVQAAAFFRGELDLIDPYLRDLAEAYPEGNARSVAAHRLMLAAETMDEAAIFTIDAWCQRMLREHAFDSGSLFDEELLTDERALFEDAAHDYWRQHVYPLGAEALDTVLGSWSSVEALKESVRELVYRTALLGELPEEPLGAVLGRLASAQRAQLAQLKEGWHERASAMERWIAAHRERNPKCFNGNKMRADSLVKWFEALRAWALDPALHQPALPDTAWKRLTEDGIVDAFSKDFHAEVPDCFGCTAELKAGLDAIDPIAHALLRHAAGHIAQRMRELKRRNRQFGFADMLERLKDALEGENGDALRGRIVSQFPVAMVDEFQDTSPDQYRIFDLLYRVADNAPGQGLFLIGDPKQSIYGFRGADIHSYLSARRATEGRHYKLGTNYRSTAPLVSAVNRVFAVAEGEHGEGGYPQGAFRFRRGGDNPLPFEAVAAKGHRERLVGAGGTLPAMTVACCHREDLKGEEYREFFAQHCAEDIVRLLNDERVGFSDGERFRRLMPADIAILVRDRREAAAVRRALVRRMVASVYLSDKDSVIESEEAADMLRWLYAVANPLDGALARAAFATRTAGLPLVELARLSSNEEAWEVRVEQLKALHGSWQRQGVLAMLRRFVHELGLPARLLREPGGERRLTNLLHLAELLQEASTQLEGEQALIRWFAEQIEGLGEGGDERVLRLESDAELVKVVTVHKSKGLEYPLVYLPFAVTARPVEKGSRAFFEFIDQNGERRLDLSLSAEAQAAVDRARLEEDLRLFYVALTRARHAVWLGTAVVLHRGKNRLHESAFGYLLAGGEAIPPAALRERLQQLCGGVDCIRLLDLEEDQASTAFSREDERPDLLEAPRYAASFERDWAIGSFTSLTRHAVAPPMRAQEQTLLEEEPSVATPPRIEDAPWHRFPRGSVPGNFLHEQLEWLAGEGFGCLDDPACELRLVQRIERAGWAKRTDDALAWLKAIVGTVLPPLGAALGDLQDPLPEMEFWFPSERLDLPRLDRLCRERIFGGAERPVLPERTLHGMLKGFADLVFEHEGRFWVLDYKSNALGPGDAAYTQAAMEAGMMEHRYDIQGTIYMLALHRLLRARLGQSYRPREQLGGAVFLFLRGIANPATRGCCTLAPDLELLDGLERLLNKEGHGED